MQKILGLLLLLGVGGLAMWYFSRGKSAAAAATPSPTNVTVEGHTYSFDEPGIYEIPLDDYFKDSSQSQQIPLPAPEPTIGTPEKPLTTEIPGGLIPHTGTGSWYEIRNIEEVLGWSPDEYVRMQEKIRTTPAVSRTAEMQYAGGYSDTMAQAEAAVDFRTQVINLGGTYRSGILVVPSDFEGSVTEFAQYVRSTLN